MTNKITGGTFQCQVGALKSDPLPFDATQVQIAQAWQQAAERAGLEHIGQANPFTPEFLAQLSLVEE